jgi:hypothetical protein
MTEPLDMDEIRYRLEERWKKLGYDNLLEEERDYILTWWLEVEASNGTLDQYFSNSTGDSAIDTHAALLRLGASNAAGILQEAMSLFGSEFPTDRKARNDTLKAMTTTTNEGDDILDKLTDRLFSESEDVRSLALDRVGDAYVRNAISDVPQDRWPARRLAAVVVLAGIAISVVGSLILLAQKGD